MCLRLVGLKKTVDQKKRFLQDGDSPVLKIKFSTFESLEIDSWYADLIYNALCKVVGAGINAQLKENTLVRDVLGLGAPLADGAVGRMTKMQRVGFFVFGFFYCRFFVVEVAYVGSVA